MNFLSLPQFYNSAEWRKFRAFLINERMNKKDGLLYDEHSGEVLLKPHDIVLHHKIPLTIQNVNNADISLNPENIMIVSHRSHNEIHARFGFATERPERKVYYVYGAPCSGKTTFVNGIKSNSDLVVDMDNIWQCVTGGERYFKPAALRTNVFNIRDCLYDMVRKRAGKWSRAFVIDGGASRGARARLIESLGAEPVFIDVDRETCIERLMNDNTRTPQQKTEWLGYIERWFEDYTE